jgi:hypothetical protein
MGQKRNKTSIVVCLGKLVFQAHFFSVEKHAHCIVPRWRVCVGLIAMIIDCFDVRTGTAPSYQYPDQALLMLNHRGKIFMF